MSHDYVVIGGGASGMAVAIILAGQGKRVALVERAPRPGPVLRGFVRQGCRLDSGFHYAGGLGPGQTLSAYFRHLGLEPRLQLDPEPVVETLRIAAPPGEWRLPCDGSLPDRLGELFPEEREGIRQYFDAVTRELSNTPFLNLAREREPEDLPPGRLSLAQVLERCVAGSVPRRILGMHHFFYGVMPENISFSDHVRYAGFFHTAARRILGGGAALVRAFEAALNSAGVEVFTGCGARSVEVTPAGAVSGVRLESNDLLPCGACVMAVHPRLALALAPREAFRAAYAQYIASLPETPSAYMLHGLTTERVSLLEPGGLHLATTPRLQARDYWLGPLEERPMFLARAGEPNPEAPPGARVGAQVFGAILPAAHGETEAWSQSAPGSRPREYLEHKERVAGILARRLEDQCPELRGRWKMLEMATPLTFRHHGGSPFGSLYGVQQRMDSLRIMPQTRLENLYLTGQNLTGPGVLGAVISAYATCGRIVGRERLLAEVRRCA